MVVQKILEHFANDKGIYLLDEPTTYLDSANVNKIVNLINKKNSTFCIATHDRSFLEKVCTKLWIIEQGELVEFNGNYTEYKEQKEIKISEYNSELKKYQKETRKIRDTIRSMKEEQQGKTLGKPKNMMASDYRIIGTKTKITQNQKKMQKNILRQEEKLNSLSKPKKIEEEYDISFLNIFNKRSKRSFYIEEKEFFINGKCLWMTTNLSFSSGDKVMLVGKNGSGKTTFLNYIKEQIPNKKVSILSNGEKVKLYFISLLFQETDVLLLDELTNFLDIVTIEAVEKILSKYPGILIMVSHDSQFVKNVATKVIELNSKEILRFR